MWTLKRSIAALMLVAVLSGPAMAHRMFERVYDPSTGDTFRQEVPHRHRADGSVVVYDSDYSYSSPRSYSSYYSTPYYSSSYYRPYGYAGDYGYRRQSSVGPALLGAGIGYAIGRSSRR